MDRDVMALRLFCMATGQVESVFVALREQDKELWRNIADAAIRECANAAEEAYREGAAHGHAYSSDWMHSATRAKWGK